MVPAYPERLSFPSLRCELRLHKLSVAAALAVLAAGVQAQGLTQNFDAGIPASWTLVNNSATPLGNNWFQGNSAIFPAFNGADTSYAAANFVSTLATTGAVSNWMILPALTLDSTSTISFRVRGAGDSFSDQVEVRFSPGTGADVGTTTTSSGTFNSLLGFYTTTVDAGWVSQTYNLGLAIPTEGRIAFRYVVADVATAGNYLGIDNVVITAIPEPGTYALFALGLAGVMLRRRFSH